MNSEFLGNLFLSLGPGFVSAPNVDDLGGREPCCVVLDSVRDAVLLISIERVRDVVACNQMLGIHASPVVASVHDDLGSKPVREVERDPVRANLRPPTSVQVDDAIAGVVEGADPFPATVAAYDLGSESGSKLLRVGAVGDEASHQATVREGIGA